MRRNALVPLEGFGRPSFLFDNPWQLPIIIYEYASSEILSLLVSGGITPAIHTAVGLERNSLYAKSFRSKTGDSTAA
jgi:hypothetical protein